MIFLSRLIIKKKPHSVKKEGKLINKDLKTLKPIEEPFADRKTASSKIRKLSTIILSKGNKSNNSIDLNSNILDKQMGRSTIAVDRKTYTASRSPQNKFIRIS